MAKNIMMRFLKRGTQPQACPFLIWSSAVILRLPGIIQFLLRLVYQHWLSFIRAAILPCRQANRFFPALHVLSLTLLMDIPTRQNSQKRFLCMGKTAAFVLTKAPEIL